MQVFQYIMQLTLCQFVYYTLLSYYLVQLAKLLILTLWISIKELIPLNNVLAKYSSPQSKECWAVITGATDGIGLGFA